MPNILLKVPKNTFPDKARANLVQRINAAAAEVEQIAADPTKRALCWVVIDEVENGLCTLGGADMGTRLIPCVAVIYVPAGVLDHSARARYVELVHKAFEQALPDGERRKLVSSVVLHDVADGAWGANGAIWTLPIFAREAGFGHLQHLAAAA